MKKFTLMLIATLALCSAFAGQDIKPKAFAEGSNVCFVGDSITHSGAYIKDIVTFYITRFPKLKINFYNVGISGDIIQHVNKRTENDILVHKPSVATLMIGMNNVNVFEKPDMTEVYAKKVKENRDIFKSSLDSILEKFEKANCAPTLLTPSIYDETMVSKDANPAIIGKNGELGYFAKHIRAVAKKRGLKLVDMYDFTLETNKKFQKDFPNESVVGGDRVHPRGLGGHVMMTKFIDAMDESEYVYNVEIDAKNKKVEKAFNVDVENIEFAKDSITFTLKEYALPYPLSADAERAEKYVNFSEYNKQIIEIEDLPKGDYELFVDGKSVGKYSSKELSDGVNLANNKNTPQYAQGREVLKVATLCRNAWNKLREINATEMWQNLEELKTDDEKIAAVKKCLSENKIKHPYIKACAERYIVEKPKQAELWKKSRDMFESLYKTAQPKPHKYELKKL